MYQCRCIKLRAYKFDMNFYDVQLSLNLRRVALIRGRFTGDRHGKQRNGLFCEINEA